MRLIRTAHGVIHDLQSANALPALADLLLIVSPRTLYVINNLLGEDAAFYSRWASAMEPGLYEPVQQDTSDAVIVDAIIDIARLDVMPINPDLIAVLADLVTALGNRPATNVQCGEGGGTCDPLVAMSPVAPCLAGISPSGMNDEVGIDDVVPGTPPDGFDTWGEYTAYKCSAAWSLVRAIEAICDNISSAGFAGDVMVSIQAGVLAGVIGLGFVFPPALFIATLGALAAIAVLSTSAGFVFKQVADYFRANESDLVCSLYVSGTAADAIDAISNVVEDAIQGISWGSLAALSGAIGPLIASSLSIVQSNTFVNPLFRLVTTIVATGEECQCTEGCGHFIKFGSWDAGVYSAVAQSGDYYLEVQFNATAENTYCGDEIMIVDFDVVSGTLTSVGSDTWRLSHQNGQQFLNGASEPTWPVSGVGDLTIVSDTMFTCRIDWV